MSARLRPPTRAMWRDLLGLGEQLMARATIASQRELIAETAAHLTRGQAVLWLGQMFRWLPDAGADTFPDRPPSNLMIQALDARRALCSEGAQPDAPTVAVPLRAHDTVLGVLQVERPGGPPFSDAELELLDGLAVQSAVALHAKRQVAVERWRVEQLGLVRGVSAQVANVLDLDELCRRVAKLIVETFEYYYVALFTLEEEGRELRFRASAGPLRSQPDGSEAPIILKVQVGEGIIGHVAQEGVEILANDVSIEPRYRYSSALPETRSETALPLKIGERVLGVLDVQSDVLDGFDEVDMLVLRALSDTISVAVEGARLYGHLHRRADQLATVGEVSRSVASILDLDVLLDRTVDLIQTQLGFPSVHLFTVDPARERIVYRAGRGPRSRELQGSGLSCSVDDGGIISWASHHGETVLVGDVQRDSRFRPSGLVSSDTRAQLAVPLVFGEEVMGVLEVQSDRPDAFGEDDLSLLKTLCDGLSVAIRNARLYRSERWRRQAADSLREVAGLLSADVALDQVLDAILTELERTLPSDLAAIWLLDDDDLCLAAIHGEGAEVCVRSEVSESRVWLDQALRSDRPLVRTPESPREPLGATLGFAPDYSAVAAPLRAAGRPLGLLVLAHRASGRYGDESRAMTAAFASYAAVAIENTRLYQSAQEQAWVSTVMLQVAEATQSLSTLDQVLEAVVRLTPMLVGVDRCTLLLWDESAQAFVPAAAYGLNPFEREIFDGWRIAPGDALAFDQLRLMRTPVVVRDAESDPRLSGLALSELGFESLSLLPLLARGEVLGAMLVNHREDVSEFEERVLSNERMMILQGIANQAAAAVESTRLWEAQQEEAYVSAALLQVAQAVARLGDLGEILGTIVRITPLLVGVEWCAVFLWDGEQAEFRLGRAYGLPRTVEQTLVDRRYPVGDVPLLDAVRERGDLIVRALEESSGDSAGPDDRFLTELGVGLAGEEARSSRSLLVAPLAVKGDVLGAMVLEEGEASPRLRERRREIITGIADQAALAVQNDRLQEEMAGRERLERELQLAREIQQAFMPSTLPRLAGWELAVAWRAARQVAGDFYDYFELPGGRLGLVIADVADKGMPAALFMVLTRTLVRAAALESTSPATVLRRVNDLLVPDAQQGMFVTAFYAILVPETHELIYANAGHNLPLLLRSATGEQQQLRKGGMALGVLEGVDLEDNVVRVEPGDCLVCYTDGVTDALSSDEELFGQERLRAAIRSGSGGSAQAILDAVDQSIRDFVGDTPPFDDLTLLVLRRAEG